MRTYVLPVASKILEARKENRDLLFYDAPCVLLFRYPTKDPIDPTIAAEALGLGSCMIGTLPVVLHGDKKLGAKWGIPSGRFPSIAVILGHPAVKFHNGVQRRFASVSHL